MMKLLPLLLALSASRRASTFTPSGLHPTGRQMESSPLHGLAALPTVEEVSSGDFMKQLGVASKVMPLLHPQEGAEISEEDSAALPGVLSGMFSHKEGVRGFLACYFTFLVTSSDEGTQEIPDLVADAVRGADPKIVVPLLCSNVVMPTAMVSFHKEDDLKKLSIKTATNGRNVLGLLKGTEDVISNCQAILSICQDAEEGSEDLVKYWKTFFENSKFDEQQKKDIAQVLAEFC